jgi:hypothetical protein
LLMQSIINGTYGGAVGLGLFLLGVPYATLWGFLAAILRFIPYVGPAVAALLPSALSLAVFPGWVQPLLVIALIVALELASNLVMEPLLYGQSAGVSAVALLVAVAFWTWLWGPLGLFLATPLTVCLGVLGKYVPQLEFLGVLMGDEPVLEPHVRYYQRLLARDQHEAAGLAEDYRDTYGSEAFYDALLIPDGGRPARLRAGDARHHRGSRAAASADASCDGGGRRHPGRRGAANRGAHLRLPSPRRGRRARPRDVPAAARPHALRARGRLGRSPDRRGADAGRAAQRRAHLHRGPAA